MCKASNDGHARAFWSIDAAFALVLSVAMFAMFSAMLHSASIMALSGADETSGVLLSARFSSHALSQIEDGRAVDLQAVLEQTGRKYASLRIVGTSENLTFSGEKSGDIYCMRRIYIQDGKMMKLEACIG